MEANKKTKENEMTNRYGMTKEEVAQWVFSDEQKSIQENNDAATAKFIIEFTAVTRRDESKHLYNGSLIGKLNKKGWSTK